MPTLVMAEGDALTPQIAFHACKPPFGSEATVSLIQYLTVTGKGEPYRGPGTKR